MKTLVVFFLACFVSTALTAQTLPTRPHQNRVEKDQNQSKFSKDLKRSSHNDDSLVSLIRYQELLNKVVDKGLLADKNTIGLAAKKNFHKKSSSTGSQNMDSLTYEYFDPEENMWTTEYVDHYTYDSNGNQLTSVYYENDPDTGESTISGKEEYAYDSDNNQILYISSSWDYENEDWVGDSKEESEYDSDGNLILYISYSWDYLENTWMATNKQESIFENGMKKMDSYSNWDYESSDWTSPTVETFEYIDDLLVSIITTGSDNNYDGEINKLDWRKTGFFYNSQKNLTSIVSYENIDENVVWEASEKTEYSYNEDQEIETAIYSFIMEEEWIIQYMVSYTYDPNGNMPSILISYTDGSEWFPAYRELYNYDSDGNLTLYAFSGMDFENDVWEDYERRESTYDSNGNIISEIYYEDSSTPYKAEMTYNDSYSFSDLNIPNYFPEQYFKHMLTELTEYELIDDEWVVWYRSKLYYSENNSSGIQEITIPQISVFPNPASESVTFQGNFIPRETEVEIYDTQGVRVLQEVLQINGQVNIANLPEGIYFYKLSSRTHTNSGKLVIR